MGISALWDLIKEQDHSVSIAKLAEEHYKRHGRPLRIAIDEADWRFNNLTQQQVYVIRAKSDQPAFQGIEKSMFYRICKYLTLNIQLLFVFDGPNRPWKRGKTGGNMVDYEKLRLLKELLSYFRIPYHEAPGEAEAECARLQNLGIVDAVFSQDSDSLMFGCDFLIRDDRKIKTTGSTNRAKGKTKKDAALVRVVRGHEIKEKHDFDREGLVLFAMLCGGDYDMKGLERCGPALAVRAISNGFGRTLCQCQTQADCASWREELVNWMPNQYKGHVPFDYPNIKTLKKYNCPTVSTDAQLLNLRGLQKGWNQPIQEMKLLELTSSRFNIWGRLYMNWEAPVLLARYLVARDSLLPRENPHAIQLTKRRVKKTDDAEPRPLELKLTFSPFGVTELTKADFEGDGLGYWTSAADQGFDPDYRVECNMPDYLLQKVLPLSSLDPRPAERSKAQRKRNRPADKGEADFEHPTPAAKSRRTVAKDAQSAYSPPLPCRANKPVGTLTCTFASPTRAPDSTRSYRSVPSGTVIDLVSDEDDSDSDHLEKLDLTSLGATFAPAGRAPSPRRTIMTGFPSPLHTVASVRAGRAPPDAVPTTTASPIRATASSVVPSTSTAHEDSHDEDAALERAIALSLQGSRRVSKHIASGGPSGQNGDNGAVGWAEEWDEDEDDADRLLLPADATLLNMSEMRTARLAHFEQEAKRAEDVDAGHGPTGSGTPRMGQARGTTRPMEDKKWVGVIDLTED